MSGPLKPLSQHDFSGGVNAVVSPTDAGPKQSLRISNMILDEHGSLRTVDGTKIVSTAPAALAGYRLLMPLSWQPIGGPLQRLVIPSLPAAVNKLYDRSTTPWTLIGNFDGDTPIPQLAILNNLMVFTDGYFAPKSWGGTTFGPLAGYPAGVGAQHIIQHEGFLYTWNTSAATTLTDSPSVLRQSDLNDPNTWNNAQIIFVDKDDGYQGQGMAVFTIAEAGIPPNDTLVLFKDRATYQMTGNMGTGGGAPSSNFTLQRIKSDMGCYAPKTIQFCAGFGVIRLSHRGFALFDGTDDRLLSEEIRPYLFGRDDILPLDWTHAQNFWSLQCQNPPIYVALCSLDGMGLTRGFLYDLVRKAWTVIDFPFTLASGELIAEPQALPFILLGDAADATALPNLRRWFAQDLDWDGDTIVQNVRSREAFDGGPTQSLYFRALLLEFLAETAAQVTYTTTYSSGTVKGPYAQDLAAGSAPNIVTADLGVTARHARYDLCITGVVRFRAHDWLVRKKPLRGTNI